MTETKVRVCHTSPLVTDELVYHRIRLFSAAFEWSKFHPFYTIVTFSTASHFLSEVTLCHRMSPSNVNTLYNVLEGMIGYMERFPPRLFFGYPTKELQTTFSECLEPIWGFVSNIVQLSVFAHDCEADPMDETPLDCHVPNCLISRARDLYYTLEHALEQDYLLRRHSIHKFRTLSEIVAQAPYKQCPICLDKELTEDADFSYLSCCRHLFCSPCIAEWMNRDEWVDKVF